MSSLVTSTERSISAGSRPMAAQWSSSTRDLCAITSRRAEGVPGVGPLRDEPQHDLLAAAADQHGDAAAHGRRVEHAEARVDHRQRVAERLQARDRACRTRSRTRRSRARTSPSRGRGSAGRPRCGRPCAPCRPAGWGCGRSCSSRARRSGCARWPRPSPPSRRPALEVRAVGIAEERVEVVPGEERVGAGVVCPQPGVAHLPVGAVLRRDAHADADGPVAHDAPSSARRPDGS